MYPLSSAYLLCTECCLANSKPLENTCLSINDKLSFLYNVAQSWLVNRPKFTLTTGKANRLWSHVIITPFLRLFINFSTLSKPLNFSEPPFLLLIGERKWNEVIYVKPLALYYCVCQLKMVSNQYILFFPLILLIIRNSSLLLLLLK